MRDVRLGFFRKVDVKLEIVLHLRDKKIGLLSIIAIYLYCTIHQQLTGHDFTLAVTVAANHTASLVVLSLCSLQFTFLRTPSADTLLSWLPHEDR